MVCLHLSQIITGTNNSLRLRLLQYAPDYYNLSSGSFPEGETKRVLKSIVAKTRGRSAEEEKRNNKKRRVQDH